MKKRVLLLITIFGFILFFQILFNGFVDDDKKQVVDNSLVLSITNIPKFFRESNFYDPATNKLVGIYYRPISLVYFTSIVSLFGLKAVYLHFFQITLYILNSFLVYLLLRVFFHERVAILLAIIFLVHPINSEVAAYISDTHDVLYFFFGMLAVVSTLYRKNLVGILLSCIFLILALLSKESGMLFFIIVSLIQLRRLFLIQTQWKKQFLPFSILISGILLFYALMRLGASIDSASNRNILSIISAKTLQNTMPSMLFFYIKTFLFPKDLSFAHLWIVTDVNFATFYFPLLVDILFICAICFLGDTCWKRKQYFTPFLFFASWFVTGMLFHINILFRLDLIAAERWFYFPFVGLLGLLGIAIELFVWQKKRVRFGFVLSLCFVVILFSMRTAMRLPNWKDEKTLYTHDLKVEYNPLLENVYGNWLLESGKDEEAHYYLDKSKEVFSRWYKEGLPKTKD